MSLFYPKKEEELLHPSVERLITSKPHEPAKRLINHYFSLMGDLDGNFAQQFRSYGHDARTFELGLYAFLDSQQCKFKRVNLSPDFIINRKGVEVCVEATTSNPSAENQFKNTLRYLTDISGEELIKKVTDEVPIRLGSPLFSKLKKKYWDLQECKNKPFIVAIQAFHEAGSLTFSDVTLLEYLYGLRSYPIWSSDGETILKQEEIQAHEISGKKIPSNFFKQKDTENISAILFSNSLTIPKFVRMAYQSGDRNGEILDIVKSGTCRNFGRNDSTILEYEYSLNDPPLVESWGEGLHLMHNPNAKIPLPLGYFDQVTESYSVAGKLVTDVYGFQPFSIFTHVQIKPQDR